MKHLPFLLLFLPLLLPAQTLRNVLFRQEGNLVVVNCDLIADPGDRFDVQLLYSSNGGSDYRLLKYVSGDAGPDQTGGLVRQIRWEAVREEGQTTCASARFRVRATLTATGNNRREVPLPETRFVEGGTFRRDGYDIAVSSFHLGTYEVSNAQLAVFLTAQGNQTEAGSPWYDSTGLGAALVQRERTWRARPGFEDHPVCGVSWYGAVAYTRWLSDLTGQTWHLPTEAEWEYAAGGGATGRTLLAGTSRADELGDFAWYSTNAQGPAAVGTRRPNSLVLCDMSGNVYEWCADWYASYVPGAATDPRGPDTGTTRVLRGGSYAQPQTDCRVTKRFSAAPAESNPSWGFRVARRE
ncbi:MAG: hypothetical protein OHK0039_47890 [Bacteroidia bacterium]